jgi:hypothetical protein
VSSAILGQLGALAPLAPSPEPLVLVGTTFTPASDRWLTTFTVSVSASSESLRAGCARRRPKIGFSDFSARFGIAPLQFSLTVFSLNLKNAAILARGELRRTLSGATVNTGFCGLRRAP